MEVALHREPLPREVLEHVPPVPFDLDEKLFLRCLLSSTRGAAVGPSGMTNEHLRPLLIGLRASAVQGWGSFRARSDP